VLVASGAGDQALWANTLARLDPIAMGALLAAWHHGKALAMPAARRLALALAAVLALLAAGRYGAISGPHALWTYPLVALAGTAAVLAVLHDAGTPRALRWPLLVGLGRISYGLYVFHVLALALVAARLPSLPVPGRAAAALTLTAALATVSYYVLERPFLRLKRRFAYVETGPTRPPRPGLEGSPAACAGRG
jgi:peptidoglycan/LPS O-acetylase OafA/YrhL